MSFELRINPKKLGEPNKDNGEMKIDINFHSEDENKQHAVPSSVTGMSTSTGDLKARAETSVAKKKNPIGSVISKLKSKLAGLKRRVNNKMNQIKVKSAENAAKKKEDKQREMEKKKIEDNKTVEENKEVSKIESDSSETTNTDTGEEKREENNNHEANRKKKKKKKKKRR